MLANLTNGTYIWCTMERLGKILLNMQPLSCIIIGRIFYGMV